MPHPAASEQDHLAQLRSLDREELVRIIVDDAKNWLAHDGLWCQAVERAHGMEAAIAADRDAWARFTDLRSGVGLALNRDERAFIMDAELATRAQTLLLPPDRRTPRGTRVQARGRSFA